MKKHSALRNSVVFSVTAAVVLLLAFGIYASNRLLTHWLLVRNLQETSAQLPEALATAGFGDEFSFIDPEKATPTGILRLQATGETADENTAPIELPVRQMSPQLEAYLSSALQPSRILSNRFVATAEIEQGRRFGKALAPLFNDPDSKTYFGDQGLVLQALLERLSSHAAPYTLVQMTWWGKLESASYLIFPQIGGKDVKGALVVLLDNTDRIENLSLITLISSGIIAVLCLASFLFASFLFWMRFREQVKTTRDIEFLAHHDALTGLPNRAVFNARLNEALRLAQAKASNMGVMLIDVDKFKEINDTYGHGTGDIFLQIIADRLRMVFGDHLVSRLSGDEFAVMIQSVSDVARLTRLASEMLAATEHPCLIDGKEIKISLSIGIARASDGSWRASRLLHCADLALYRAKHSGRSTFAWYTPEMDADAKKRKEIEAGLVKALKFDQFDLLYQPQYSLADNQLKGYESLIRWEHPTKGTISPEVFIPVAEDCGLIEAIGDWVLMRACREAAMWPDKSLGIAVNVSAAQFMAGETHKKVARALTESQLDPSRLEIEITESLLISNTEAVVETLNKIRAMGVSIAMDDFGTGYSSLSYLSLFPFDKIKIDRSFIHNLGKDASTDAIVTSIIGLGRSLDVLITAEGVENQEQVTLLRAAGCNLVQGYLFGRPGTVQSHADFMARNDPRPNMAHLKAHASTQEKIAREAAETAADAEMNEADEAEAETTPASAAS